MKKIISIGILVVTVFTILPQRASAFSFSSIWNWFTGKKVQVINKEIPATPTPSLVPTQTQSTQENPVSTTGKTYKAMGGIFSMELPVGATVTPVDFGSYIVAGKDKSFTTIIKTDTGPFHNVERYEKAPNNNKKLLGSIGGYQATQYDLQESGDKLAVQVLRIPLLGGKNLDISFITLPNNSMPGTQIIKSIKVDKKILDEFSKKMNDATH